MPEFYSDRSDLDPVSIRDAYLFATSHVNATFPTNVKGLTEGIINADGELPFGDDIAPYGLSELHNFKIGSEYFQRNRGDNPLLYKAGSKIGEYFAGGHFLSEISWFMDLNGSKFKTPLAYQNHIYDIAQTDTYNGTKTSTIDEQTKYRKINCRLFHDQCVFNSKLEKNSPPVGFQQNLAHIEYSSSQDYRSILNPWITYTARTYFSDEISYIVWPKEVRYQRGGLYYTIYNAVDGDYRIGKTPGGGYGALWGYAVPEQVIHTSNTFYTGSQWVTIYIPVRTIIPPGLNVANTNHQHWWYHTQIGNHGYPSTRNNNYISVGTQFFDNGIDNSDTRSWAWMPFIKVNEIYYHLPSLYEKIHDKDFWTNDPINILLRYDSAMSDGSTTEIAEDYFARFKNTDSSPNGFGRPNIENSKLKLVDPGASVSDTESRILIESENYQFGQYVSSKYDGVSSQTCMEQISESPYIPDVFLRAGDHGHGYFQFDAGTTLDYYIKKVQNQYRLYEKGGRKIDFADPLGSGYDSALLYSGLKIINRLYISTVSGNVLPHDQCFWDLKLAPGRKTILSFKYLKYSRNLIIYINEQPVFVSSSDRKEIKYGSFSFIPSSSHPQGLDEDGKVSCKISIGLENPPVYWNGGSGAAVDFIECQQEAELVQSFNSKEDALEEWKKKHYMLANYAYNSSSYIQEDILGFIFVLLNRTAVDGRNTPKINTYVLIDGSFLERSAFQIKLNAYAVFRGDSDNKINTYALLNIRIHSFLGGEYNNPGSTISRPGLPFIKSKCFSTINNSETDAAYVQYDTKQQTQTQSVSAQFEMKEIVIGQSISYWLRYGNSISHSKILPALKVEYSTDGSNWEPVNDPSNCYFVSSSGDRLTINSSGLHEIDMYDFAAGYGNDGADSGKFYVNKASKYFPKPSSHNYYYFRLSYISNSNEGPFFQGTVLAYKILRFVAVNKLNKNELVLFAVEPDFDIFTTDQDAIAASTLVLKQTNQGYAALFFEDEYHRAVYCFAGGEALEYQKDISSLNEEDSQGNAVNFGFNIEQEILKDKGESLLNLESLSTNNNNEFNEKDIQPDNKKITRSSWALMHNLRVKGEDSSGNLSELNYRPYNHYSGDLNSESYIAGESLHGPFSTKAKSTLSFLRFEAFRRSFVERGAPAIINKSSAVIKFKMSMGGFLPRNDAYSTEQKDPVRTINDTVMPPADGKDGNGWSDIPVDLVYNSDTNEHGDMPTDQNTLLNDYKIDRINWDGYMNYIIGTRDTNGNITWGRRQQGSFPRANPFEKFVFKLFGRDHYITVGASKYNQAEDYRDQKSVWTNFGYPNSSYSFVEAVIVFRKNNQTFSINENQRQYDADAIPNDPRYVWAIKTKEDIVWELNKDGKTWSDRQAYIPKPATKTGVVWDWNGWSKEIPSIQAPSDKIYMSVGIFRYGERSPSFDENYSVKIYDDDGNLVSDRVTEEMYPTEDGRPYRYRTKNVGHIYWTDPVLFAEGTQKNIVEFLSGPSDDGSINGATMPHLYLPRERSSGLKLNYHYFVDLEDKDKLQLEIAREYWESIITTDMEIDVNITLMSGGGVGGTLASAGPREMDESSSNTFLGAHPQITTIQVNLDPFDIYEGTGRELIDTRGKHGMLNGVTQLCAIMIHELWHGFGAGPNWRSVNQYSYILKNGLFGSEYVGQKALQKYKEMVDAAKYAKYINKTNYNIETDSIQSLKNQGILAPFDTNAVPTQGYGLEIEITEGKKGGHFAEYARKSGNTIRPTFTEMISAIYDVKESPMTSVGIGMLEDLGYSVDYNAVAKDGSKLIKTSFENDIDDPIIIYTGIEYFTHIYYKVKDPDFRNSVSLEEYLSNPAYGVQEASSYLTEGYNNKRVCTSCGHYHADINLNEETDNSIDPERTS